MEFSSEKIAEFRRRKWRIYSDDKKTLNRIKELLRSEKQNPKKSTQKGFLHVGRKQLEVEFFSVSFDVALTLRNERKNERYVFTSQHKKDQSEPWRDWKEGEVNATRKGKTHFNFRNDKPRDVPGLTWKR